MYRPATIYSGTHWSDRLFSGFSLSVKPVHWTDKEPYHRHSLVRIRVGNDEVRNTRREEAPFRILNQLKENNMNKNASKSTSTIKTGSIYELNGRPPFAQAFPLGFQQLLAMFVGNIVPMILVANASGMDTSHATLLLQCSILGAGVATLLQVFPIRFGIFNSDQGCLS